MGWFTKDKGITRQIEVYKERMQTKQKELDTLANIDTPESGLRREELAADIAELEISLEQIHSDMEQQGMGGGSDLFHD